MQSCSVKKSYALCKYIFVCILLREMRSLRISFVFTAFTYTRLVTQQFSHKLYRQHVRYSANEMKREKSTIVHQTRCI